MAKKTRRDTREILDAPTERVRYAVVGLGWIAQSALLPAFAGAKRNSRLVALVSDDATKLEVLGRKYGVRALYRSGAALLLGVRSERPGAGAVR